MSNAIERIRARSTVQALAELGNKVVSFTGAEGAVSTVGYIDQVADFLIMETQMTEKRYQVTLLPEDVGDPHRNDTVTDEDGNVWSLTEQLRSNDPFVIIWGVERKWL